MQPTRFPRFRRISHKTVGIACGAIIALAGLIASPAVHAQDRVTRTLVAFEHTGAESLLVSPKDAGLKRALSMLPTRIEELRDAVPELQEIPKPVIDMAMKLGAYPMRFAITDKGIDPDTGMPGIGVVASWQMTGDDPARDARTIHQGLTGVMMQAGGGMQIAESQVHEGFSSMPLPFGALAFGPYEANDGWRYEMRFGLVEDPAAPFADMPSGDAEFKPVMHGKLDLAAMTPMVQMFGGMAMMMVPNGQDLMKNLREQGLTGEDAMSFEMTAGYRGDNSVSRMVAKGMKNFAPQLGVPTTPIPEAAFAAIPADATFAQIKQQDLGFAWTSIREQLEAADPDALQEIQSQFTNMTGLDLEADLINTLGDTYALYLSDSTGGGSFLSAVSVIWLDDAETLYNSLSKLAEQFNTMIDGEIEGPFKVRIDAFSQGGVRFMQLRTPGLPIPFEPTIAIIEDKLVMGATPQALFAAGAQITGNGAPGDVRSNPALAPFRGGMVSASAFTFVDSARTIGASYPYVTLAGSAIANAMRSHVSTSRDPGLVVPPFSILAKDVRPMVTWSTFEGDDYVTQTSGDASVLVSICSVLGVGDLAPMLAGAALGSGITAGIMQEMQGSMGHMQYAPEAHDHDDDEHSHEREDTDY